MGKTNEPKSKRELWKKIKKLWDEIKEPQFGWYLISGFAFLLLIILAFLLPFKFKSYGLREFNNPLYTISLVTIIGSFIMIRILLVQISQYLKNKLEVYQKLFERSSLTDERGQMIESQKQQNLEKEVKELKEKLDEIKSEDTKWKDQKELLMKWIEAGRPDEGNQQKELWEELGKQFKEIIKDISDKTTDNE